MSVVVVTTCISISSSLDRMQVEGGDDVQQEWKYHISIISLIFESGMMHMFGKTQRKWLNVLPLLRYICEMCLCKDFLKIKSNYIISLLLRLPPSLTICSDLHNTHHGVGICHHRLGRKRWNQQIHGLKQIGRNLRQAVESELLIFI